MVYMYNVKKNFDVLSCLMCMYGFIKVIVIKW